MISVTILTKNNEKTIAEVLQALEPFDEVLVYDTGSTDRTRDLAKTFSNVHLVEAPFEGFGPTHNKATSLAKHDWILSIDSDEVVTPEMLEEIQSLQLKKTEVYSFPRHNYFNGKFIKWCGWHPERVTRLYHRQVTSFSDDQVHEGVVVDGVEIVNCKAPLIHTSYESISDFLKKMELYSELFAKQNVGKRSSSLTTALIHGFFAFFKSYIIKRGFLGGHEGFVISLYNGHTAYYKYLKLYEANLVNK